jgi:MFS family permease
VGVLFALFAVLPVFLALPAGRFADRVGPRTPMLIGVLGLAAGLAACYAVPGLPTLFVAVTAIGGFYLFFIVSIQMLVGSFGPPEGRTRRYSHFSLAIATTGMLGPVVAGFSIEGLGYREAYLVLAASALGSGAIIWRRGRHLPRPAPRAAETGARKGRRLPSRPLALVLLVSGIIETGMELFNFYVPIYGNAIGLAPSRIGIVLGCFGGAMLLARLFIPLLTRRMGEERLLAAGLAVGAVVAVAFPFVETFAVLCAMAAAFGLGLGWCTPLAMTLTYNRAPEGRAGEAMGMRQVVNKATEVMVPIVFGSVGAAFGLAPAFWLDAALLGAGAAIMRWSVRRRAGA